MNLLSKIKSFFKGKETKGLDRIFTKYLKIRSAIIISDVKASDKKLNFKVAWQGNVVPFWVSSEYEIADFVSIIATGLAFGLNLIEVSQLLKNHSNLVQ